MIFKRRSCCSNRRKKYRDLWQLGLISLLTFFDGKSMTSHKVPKRFWWSCHKKFACIELEKIRGSCLIVTWLFFVSFLFFVGPTEFRIKKDYFLYVWQYVMLVTTTYFICDSQCLGTKQCFFPASASTFWRKKRLMWHFSFGEIGLNHPPRHFFLISCSASSCSSLGIAFQNWDQSIKSAGWKIFF